MQSPLSPRPVASHIHARDAASIRKVIDAYANLPEGFDDLTDEDIEEARQATRRLLAAALT